VKRWLIAVGVGVAAVAAPLYGIGDQAQVGAWFVRTANRLVSKRRALAISPEHAAAVREDAAKRTAEDEKRERGERTADD
jgi:hypothetical protein